MGLKTVDKLDSEATYLAARAATFAREGHLRQGHVDALLAIERRLEWLGEVLATAWDDGRNG